MWSQVRPSWVLGSSARIRSMRDWYASSESMEVKCVADMATDRYVMALGPCWV
jgi:hypothetical protein